MKRLATKGAKMNPKSLLLTLTILLLTGCNLNNSPLFSDSKPIQQKVMEVQKKALIVGVSDYAGSESDLSGVQVDVKNMQQLFTEWGFDVTVLRDEKSMELEQYLARYENLDSNDKFIFYYSGHGSHTKDISGDEADGEDEALVLSDGETNELFLDDSLFGYLNAIKAKKMVMFDSCHSGTAFRGLKILGDKPRVKSLGSDLKHLFKIIKTRTFSSKQKNINSGEYVVFSASQDDEQSLDTKEGGMFTNAFYKQMKMNNGKNIKMINLPELMTKNIKTWCQTSDSIAHHPNLSASSDSIRDSSIRAFLDL